MTMKNTRATARTVGVLMLAAFLLYGMGSSLAMTATPGATLAVSTGMMMLNSVAVVAIGVLMLPILRPHAPAVAVGYLATRIFEGVLLGIGAVALFLGSASVNFLAYNIAMAGLGVGSLFFCVALYRTRLVPRFLAAWGFVGYAVFAIGCVLALSGVAGADLVSTIPGGLFEIVFAVWLIARGFRSTVPSHIVVASHALALPTRPGARAPGGDDQLSIQ